MVDTIGIKESVRYQNVPHSKDMRIKERIRPVTPDIVWDEITIDDPATLEKPWTYTLAYKRTPGYTLLEYICEDNREYTDEKGIQRFRLAAPDRVDRRRPARHRDRGYFGRMCTMSFSFSLQMNSSSSVSGTSTGSCLTVHGFV